MERIRRQWRRSTKRVRPANRYIYIDNEKPDGVTNPEGYENQKFSNNEIKTSKYTLLNFLPKNLFEQFRRIANFYFLCVAIIQVVADSPTSPWTSLLPLVFVVVVTAIKQGYEDFLRHRNDRQVNCNLVEVVREGVLEEIEAQHIKVGDIVKIDDDDSFPCDIVLLSSSDKDGKCYITTANLDGETNYKEKLSPRITRFYNTPAALRDLKGAIECEQPTVNLYEFKGTIKVLPNDNESVGEMAPLGLDNILLRGARLKDTEYIFGCAVYTGQDTKLALNSLLTNNKFSTVEKSMNWFLIVFLVLLILEISLCTIQKYVVQKTLGNSFFLIFGLIPGTTFRSVVSDMASFLIIFNYVIPISLYVTIEMQKFLGSLFFVWDEELYCPEADERPVCNSSDLNEELGQVQYLLTDKTGTLTENCMEFRQCSIAGEKYIEENGMLKRVDSHHQLVEIQNLSDDIEEFLLSLALCHTVTICGHYKKRESRRSRKSRRSSIYNQSYQVDLESIEYQASSPDEKALAEACLRFGVVYMGERSDNCRVMVKGERRWYQRLDILEFDSTRKRMSVILKFPDGTIKVLCKGAESAIIPRCTSGSLAETDRHIQDFAEDGLRTLAIAVRDLTEEEYEKLSEQLKNARQSMEDRDVHVAKMYDDIESNMRLLGATGVEDQLQDGVPETLEALRLAGIKVWVLTGDKLETALNIANSCGQFKPGTMILTVSGKEHVKETLENMTKKVQSERQNAFGLLIDGHSLTVALANHRELLGVVAQHCEAVVCCRMSPIQKAEVVKLVKEFPRRPITAAIGDGANDVSMIQEAHIGLGIMGKEGRQAVRCADFAFARFKFLRKVLLVHGHWYYWRVATLVQYFFYKNMAFITPVVFFSVYSAYSTQPLYDSFFLTFYNIIFTSLPILIYGLFEQNYSSTQLLENVHLYKDITANASMSWFQFLKWNALGLWHAIAIYFGAMLLWKTDPAFFSAGYTLDFSSFGTLIYHVVIFVVNIKLLIESRYWTALYAFSIAISVLAFIGLTFLYSGVPIKMLDNETFLMIYATLLSSGSAWLFLLVTICIALLPDMLCGIWDAYSAGGGVLANKTVTPGEIVEEKVQKWFAGFSKSRLNICNIKVRESTSISGDDVPLRAVSYSRSLSREPTQTLTYGATVHHSRDSILNPV